MNVNPFLFSAFEGSAAEVKGLRDLQTVAALQDQTQLTLNKYISTAYPTQPFRFGKLLLLLPSLRSVSNRTIEELFFRKTIGSIPIERIICDMYKANDLWRNNVDFKMKTVIIRSNTKAWLLKVTVFKTYSYQQEDILNGQRYMDVTLYQSLLTGLPVTSYSILISVATKYRQLHFQHTTVSPRRRGGILLWHHALASL